MPSAGQRWSSQQSDGPVHCCCEDWRQLYCCCCCSEPGTDLGSGSLAPPADTTHSFLWAGHHVLTLETQQDRRSKTKSGFWSHKIKSLLLMDFISWYDEDEPSVGLLLSYNNAIRTHRSPAGYDSHTCARWRVPSGLQGSDSAQFLKRTGSGSSCRSAWTELLQHPVEKHQLHCHHCHYNMRCALLLLVPTYCIPGMANHVRQRVNSLAVLIPT